MDDENMVVACSFCGKSFVKSGKRKTCPDCYSRFKEFGSLGGSTTSKRYGRDHYKKCGRLGGARLKELLRLAAEKENENRGLGCNEKGQV